MGYTTTDKCDQSGDERLDPEIRWIDKISVRLGG